MTSMNEGALNALFEARNKSADDTFLVLVFDSFSLVCYVTCKNNCFDTRFFSLRLAYIILLSLTRRSFVALLAHNVNDKKFHTVLILSSIS